MTHNNYVFCSSRLLKSFDRATSLDKPVLIKRYGQEANTLIQASRQKYCELIPQIPYLGEKNPLVNMFYLPASRHLAIYKAFQERGKTVEEAGLLVYEIGKAEFTAIPRFARRVINLLWFSRWFTARLQKRALLSQENKLSGGYVVSYIQGDGKEFDYEFDYTECAVNSYFRKEGAAELVPYICAIDKIASEYLGWGLCRTMTLADGGSKCDFRFKKDGKTCVGIPQSLKKVIE